MSIIKRESHMADISRPTEDDDSFPGVDINHNYSFPIV